MARNILRRPLTIHRTPERPIKPQLHTKPQPSQSIKEPPWTGPKVTFAITSTNRLDLLDKTMASFMKYNRYPIERYLLVDDSGVPGVCDTIKQRWPYFEVLGNEKKIGQTKSIDKLYAQIETEYIFHCEDDWEFLDYNFLEYSMEILTHPGNDKIAQVWLTGIQSTNGHPVLPTKYKAGTAEYYLLAREFGTHYGGFGFNPGLRRLSDYKLVGGSYELLGPDIEIWVSKKYRDLGFSAAILPQQYLNPLGIGHHSDREGTN